MGVIIIVLVVLVVIVWLGYEMIMAPLQPDDYGTEEYLENKNKHKKINKT
tara:strand:+ start:172 stop:321 length:150 start_codon:yes stop_codon:yes gene_type:complete